MSKRAVTIALDDGRTVNVDSENYPLEITIFPAEIAGAKVLAYAQSKRLEGSYPGGVALCKTSREYVTWKVYTKDGGASWSAYGGNYDFPLDAPESLAAAWQDFTKRAGTSLPG
jgi:hypothetical protein